MKLSSALDQGIDQLEAWLNRIAQPAATVPPAVHQDNQTKTQPTDAMRSRNVDSFLYRQDFKQRYDATLEGTAPRARQARRVEQKFNAYHQDGFEAFKRAPVELNPAAGSSRAFVRVGPALP